ncbi:MAG: hypothetical protein Q7S72_01655 [Candidatus Taylorbacteria bacterium]|nr:hypothetical protein [Candidatus Taylorbacteria bacterium]
MSCAVLVGIGSLIPAYIFSYTEEKSSLNRIEEIQKSREEKGADSLVKELKIDRGIMEKINKHRDSVIFSNIIPQIIRHKTPGLTINSFNLTTVTSATSSSVMVAIQGKSSTRDGLIQFKNALDADPLVTSVSLPVSDLAKSRDIPYSIKISIIPTL